MMDKAKKSKYIVLLISFLTLILFGCESDNRAEENYEEAVLDYQSKTDIEVIDSLKVEEYVMILYEDDEGYGIEYTYLDKDNASLKSQSRYKFDKENTALTAKVFGTELHDFVVMLVNDVNILENVSEMTIQIGDYQFTYKLSDVQNSYFIEVPIHLEEIKNPKITLYDQGGNILPSK